MGGSWTIRVVKRDRSVELFDVHKLAVAVWRSARGTQAAYDHALHIAQAIHQHLRRRQRLCIGSPAIFDMMIKALRHVGLAAAADAATVYRQRRAAMRQALRIRHESGSTTHWDKGWLADLAERSWHVSPTTGRLVASKVEGMLLGGGETDLPRDRVVDVLNQVMSEYGLADAVPAMR